jgi:hypothetical protein
MARKVFVRLWTMVGAAALVAVLLVPSGSAISGSQKWAIVLCNFSNQTAQPNPLSYYQQMFQGTGTSNLDWVDYWRDNSYGNLDVSATTVTGWHTLPETRDQWAGKSRFDKRVDCGNQAEADGFSFAGYYGFVTIFPEVKATLGSAAGAADTTINVNTAAAYNYYPSVPFIINVSDNAGSDNETMSVTAISGNTFTVTRGVNGTTAVAHPAGENVGVPGDIFGAGPGGFTLGGHSYTLGSAVLPSDVNLTGAAHETGHGFSYNHSRKLSTSTTDYADCYDIMSAYDTCSFSGDFGLSNLGSVNAAAGPGITSIYLDRQGWLDPSRVFDLDNSACNQTTMDLVALNQNGISGKFVARVPASIVINTPSSTTTTSDKYWLEYREATGWDAGVPPGVILHLHGADGYAYWVDSATADGRLVSGEEFADAAQKTYVAVNGTNTTTHKAQITIGGCKLAANATYSGPATADFNDGVTLAGDLKVSGSNAPVPNKTLTLSLGSQSCNGVTNANGQASCSIVITQDPGPYSAGVSYAGNSVYNAASGSSAFTITKEETQLTYSGATTSNYHDGFTATATLVDPVDATPIGGKSVTFTLGSGDTCSDTTDSSGVASCLITPTQVPASYTLAVSFGPDTDYADASTSASFAVSKEETSVTYTGPTVVLAGSSGATLSATLVEDGANDSDGDGGSPAPSPAGQTITFTLGSQSCLGVTNAAGIASCTIASVSGSSLGSSTLTTSFAGDSYYVSSSDSDTVIVFAFPNRGAFVLGDNTVTSATTTTSLSWWSDSWSELNNPSGGIAPMSFKGFASAVTSLPTQSPATVCGTSFKTTPGNSPPPTSDVPSYMGVLVAGSVMKSGSTINGTWNKIVVVRTDAGYAPAPGHPGTGTIVATFCG